MNRVLKAIPALRASKGHGVNRVLKVIPALRASKGHRGSQAKMPISKG
ncbi:hypothetical protein TUM9812_31860 [Escherichia coli]|nr:hypothetical protein TUM9812_31860 [Escherichia coli]